MKPPGWNWFLLSQNPADPARVPTRDHPSGQRWCQAIRSPCTEPLLLENLLLDIGVERSRRSPKLLNRVLVIASNAVLRRERGAEQLLSVVLKTKWNALPGKCHSFLF